MVVWDLYYSSHRYKPKLKHLKLMDTSVGLCTQRWPWVNPTQPNPWVDPTHGHLCVYSLQPVSGSRPGHGCGTSINSAYAYVSWSPQPDTPKCRSCKTADKWTVHGVVCPFTPQLSLVLMNQICSDGTLEFALVHSSRVWNGWICFRLT